MLKRAIPMETTARKKPMLSYCSMMMAPTEDTFILAKMEPWSKQGRELHKVTPLA